MRNRIRREPPPHSGQRPAALAGETQFQAVLQYLEVYAQQGNHRSHHHRVLYEAVAALGKLANRDSAEVAAAGLARSDRVAVEQHPAAMADVALVAVHGVLIQAEQEVQLVAVAEDFLVANAKGEENVATADDGLVGVVGAEMQPTTHDDASENIAGSSYALASFTADAHCEIVRSPSAIYTLLQSRPVACASAACVNLPHDCTQYVRWKTVLQRPSIPLRYGPEQTIFRINVKTSCNKNFCDILQPAGMNNRTGFGFRLHICTALPCADSAASLSISDRDGCGMDSPAKFQGGALQHLASWKARPATSVTSGPIMWPPSSSP